MVCDWRVSAVILLFCTSLLTLLCHGASENTPTREFRETPPSLQRRPASGPLRVHPANPRYFSDDEGNLVYLSGSHTWSTFQDWGVGDQTHPFDYSRFLDFLMKHDHNFTRFFAQEQASGAAWTDASLTFGPLPYVRSGPGIALDGKPKFDLNQWNPVFLIAFVKEFKKLVGEGSMCP
jgi:hypothetical protein